MDDCRDADWRRMYCERVSAPRGERATSICLEKAERTDEKVNERSIEPILRETNYVKTRLGQ